MALEAKTHVIQERGKRFVVEIRLERRTGSICTFGIKVVVEANSVDCDQIMR